MVSLPLEVDRIKQFRSRWERPGKTRRLERHRKDVEYNFAKETPSIWKVILSLILVKEIFLDCLYHMGAGPGSSKLGGKICSLEDHSRTFPLCLPFLMASSQLCFLVLSSRKPIYSVMTLLSCSSRPPSLSLPQS